MITFRIAAGCAAGTSVTGLAACKMLYTYMYMYIYTYIYIVYIDNDILLAKVAKECIYDILKIF